MTCERCEQGRGKDPHPHLEDCMQAVLNRMRVLSYGRALSFSHTPRHTDTARPGPPMFSGFEQPGRPAEVVEHVYWAERWAMCHGDDGCQEDVLALAVKQLRRITHSQADRSASWEGTWEDLRGELTAPEAVGCDPAWVAQAKRTSRTLVVRARLELGLDPENGRRLDINPGVRELAARGGVSKSTVAKYWRVGVEDRRAA